MNIQGETTKQYAIVSVTIFAVVFVIIFGIAVGSSVDSYIKSKYGYKCIPVQINGKTRHIVMWGEPAKEDTEGEKVPGRESK